MASFWAKAKKCDLLLLAHEMSIATTSDTRVFELKNLILKSPNYEENSVREFLTGIIEDRLAAEAEEKRLKLIQEEQEKHNRDLTIQQNAQEAELKRLQLLKDKELEDRNYKLEIEHLKSQLEAQKSSQTSSVTTVGTSVLNLPFKKLIPPFNPAEDDIVLFLTIFERQLTFLKIHKQHWIAYLLGVLPSDIVQLIAREPVEKAEHFDYIKALLLKRFKLHADRLRHFFASHRKSATNTWRDFSFELRNYFESWLKELDIKTFEALKDLMITDQLKKRVPPDVREHFLDTWGDWITPEDLVDKLDMYDNLRLPKKCTQVSAQDTNRKASQKFDTKCHQPKQTFFNKSFKPQTTKKDFTNTLSEFPSNIRRELGASSQSRRDPIAKDRGHHQTLEDSKLDRKTLSCYGCGAPGIIKAKCINCNPQVHDNEIHASNLNHAQSFSLSLDNTLTTIIPVTICNTLAAVCADTGATQSVAGQKMFQFLKTNGYQFQESEINFSMADGRMQKTEILTTVVDIQIRHKTIPTKLLVLKHAQGNRTLLGVDFLSKAGIVLDLQENSWFFTETPQYKNNFLVDPPNVKTLLAVPTKPHPCPLRDDEGTNLSQQQRVQLNEVLAEVAPCFQPGGGPNPFIQHRIDTGKHAPVAVPPYRLTPAKKEILKQELDKLLHDGVIEECESPYASPVVMVPKPNGKIRLCIDYRKLNQITVPDSYPLPRMDDLLHAAKQTSFMSTIDLHSGYHQVQVHEDDQDKTAFICPFGTYKFKRMPFGLKTAPATFQRLMDRFRNGLDNILTLIYLDDIIILSESFDKHLADLQAVFKRLSVFRLHANRDKCHFAMDRVKYLGFWITPNGIEVDQEKTAAIQSIPPPRSVKEVQSFLQTCSWFRRYIKDFADISRPLSNLTRKKVDWEWNRPQQQAFETLKRCLITPPILKQADGTQPYILRTDASSYAIGAVLLQGEPPDEHPIEYASRLLTQAERHYSTTEREALAVVWALKKFRGYIDGSPITVASDHQPLKWLLTLKSPTGRLARWALEVQSFNVSITYIPGKANVIADMLSRPVCKEQDSSCEANSLTLADMPTRTVKDMREAQLADVTLRKIIEAFEDANHTEAYANWSQRGFLMNQGVLYRYLPDTDSEEAQLVIPSAERESILKRHHDDPMAGHYGEEGTYQRISKRYYWNGMKKFIADYVKACAECMRYKANNQKPAGLLRTPVYSQRFEILSIDLFGPLPKTASGKQWIFIIEDCTTKWIELFSLAQATAQECATTLIEHVFMRHGIPRRIISDNGPQFVSAVMQQICFTLKIDQHLVPVYFPQANPVERKNRDLKPRLAILVGDEHDSWESKLPLIRFSLNTAVNDTTGHTPAFLTYGRELKTVDDVVQNFTTVVQNDNFVPEITPYLQNFAKIGKEIRDRVEMKQDKRKSYYDRNRRCYYFTPGDKVWVAMHPLSKASHAKTAKFMPKRDGPYLILTQKSPTTYVIANLDQPTVPIATYHTSALLPYQGPPASPSHPLRKRGRPPRIIPATPGSPPQQSTTPPVAKSTQGPLHHHHRPSGRPPKSVSITDTFSPHKCAQQTHVLSPHGPIQHHIRRRGRPPKAQT